MKNRVIFAVLAAVFCLSCSQIEPQQGDILLADGWQIQASSKVNAGGELLSIETDKISQDWFNTSIPCTVMGALTANGLYSDAFVGNNYEKIDRKQFEEPWWYRTSFNLQPLKEGQRVELAFDGISYRADVWLNGKQIASADEFFGPFRQFTFDVTDLLAEKNHLAVKVYRWQKGEFNIGFADWNPRPADESLGIFRPVWLRFSNEVSLTNAVVRSKIDLETFKKAWLIVEATLNNNSGAVVNGHLCGKLEGKSFKYPVTLQANETKTVTITSDDTRALRLKNPRLWWCHNLGNPEMYSINLSFVADKKESDAQTIDFGVREIETYLNEEGHRGFSLNGKKILIKGAGWTDDIYLRNSEERNAIEVAYVKHMNLNAIRFESVWGTSQNIYDLCDREGLLALVGWSNHWERGAYTGKANDEFGCISTEDDINLIAESFEDQVLWLRNHPSVIGWLGASDMLPREALEKNFVEIITRVDNRPFIAHAGTSESTVSGPTGMKMYGPYEWQSPSYWYNDNAKGNAIGFNSGMSIGAQMPVKESLCKFIPENKLWPMGKEYDCHTTESTSAMHDLSELKTVINKRFGGAKNLDDFLRKAHFIDYEGTRAMFEAHRMNSPRSTGVIHWMLNSAWPSVYWQLFDWYLAPTSGYWSVRKGCAPQQLVYDYEYGLVYSVNDEKEPKNLSAHMTLYDINGKLIRRSRSYTTLPEGGVKMLFRVPELNKIGFLFLSLKDDEGNIVAENQYCIPATMDRHNWDKYSWWKTPVAEYADYSGLDKLAQAKVNVSINKTEDSIQVTLTNRSSVVAFFTRMSLKDKDGELIIPAYWDDNLVTLAPRQSRWRRQGLCHLCDM